MRIDINNSVAVPRKLRCCVAAVMMTVCLNIPVTYAGTKAPLNEYQIKAMFLCNFLRFIECSVWKDTNNNEPIVIGILGDNPFGDSLTLIANKKVRNRKLTIKYLGRFKEIKDKDKLKECQLLFISSSEKLNLKKIFETIHGHCVLTISDMNGFIDSGGIINFIKDRKKIRFEINMTSAEKQSFYINSKLLRLAKRVA